MKASSLDPVLIRRVEGQIDRLLQRYRAMEEELERLRAEKAYLEADRERVRLELDRILAKFESIERKTP